jgi:hypothetical protein
VPIFWGGIDYKSLLASKKQIGQGSSIHTSANINVFPGYWSAGIKMLYTSGHDFVNNGKSEGFHHSRFEVGLKEFVRSFVVLIPELSALIGRQFRL